MVTHVTLHTHPKNIFTQTARSDARELILSVALSAGDG